MSPTFRFRAATAADVDPLVALVESAYRGEASRAGWTTEAAFLDGRRTDADDIRGCIQRDHSQVLIAEDAADSATGNTATPALLACAHIALERDEDGRDAGYFGMFAVRPGLQGNGVGKALLAEAERIAHQDWQLPTMQMTVIDLRDELIAFYQRRGYRRTGVFKPFPYGDERFGIPLRDDLRFEVLEKCLGPDNGTATLPQGDRLS